MHDYPGSCHCGAVRFVVHRQSPIAEAVECDCSLCTKKGVLLVGAQEAELEIVQGQDDLNLYQFGSKTAHHWFCKHCGIHVLNRPRTAPERYAVNARVLDAFASLRPGLTIIPFDGQNHPKDRRA